MWNKTDEKLEIKKSNKLLEYWPTKAKFAA